MSDTIIAATPRLKLGSATLSSELVDRLVGLHVHLSMHRPDEATVRFEDPDDKFLDDTALREVELGLALEVSLSQGDATARKVFSGLLTGIGVEQTDDGHNEVVLVARDRSHRFAASATPTTYLGKKTRAVVEDVATAHGLGTVIQGIGDAQHDYLVATGSHADLLDDLALREGAEWFVYNGALHFRPRKSATRSASIARRDLRGFSIHYDGQGAPAAVSAPAYDAAKADAKVVASQKVGQGAVTDALGSTAKFVDQQYKKATSTLGADLQVSSLLGRDDKEATAYADTVRERLVRTGTTVRGTLRGTPEVMAGSWVEVTDLGPSMSGEYYVTDVHHRFGGGEDLVTEIVGDVHASTAATTRPASPGSGPYATRGPVPGVVTNLDDPDKLGRVKVKFAPLGAEIESHWARVAAPGAGAERGLDLRPYVGDEVLVTFVNGDLRHPVVLGGLWSPKHKPSDAEPHVVGSKDKTARASWRSGDGALLTMHVKGESKGVAGHEHPDAWGEERPELEGAASLRSAKRSVDGSQLGASVLVADMLIASASDADTLVTNGKASIRLTKAGDIKIEGESLSIKVNKDVTAESESGGVTLTAGKSATLEGTKDVTIKGPKATVDGMSGIAIKSTKVAIGP